MDILRYIRPPQEEIGKEGSAEHEDTFDVHTFFQEHANIFADFANGSGGISVQSAQEAGLANTIQTAGIDLKNRKLYFNEVFLEKLSPAERTFVVLHEGGHLKKLLELLSDTTVYGGSIAYKHWREELISKKRYNLLDNLVADAGINKTVVAYAPVTDSIEDALYKRHLFQIKDGGDVLDMTSLPKHIQFAQVFPYERAGTGRRAKVSEDVEARLQELRDNKAGDLRAYITSKDIPESMRIVLQRQYLYPIIDELFDEDVKNQESESDKPSDSTADPGGSEDAFAEYYDAHDKASPDLIDEEEIEKAVQEYIEGGGVEDTENHPFTDAEYQKMLDEAYAQAEGVTSQDLANYRRFRKALDAIKNPKTNEGVRQGLKTMIRKIIAKRLGERYMPLYAQTEGGILQSPAEAHIAVQAGEREPRVWQSGEMQERQKDKDGEIEITVVPDRSVSMGEILIRAQKEAVVLLLETIADFNKELDEVRADLLGDLRLRSEVYSFGGTSEVEVLKPLSDSLSEKERVHVFKKLDDEGDSTQDYVALEHIRNAITNEQREKIKEGTLKKIIIVTSDGGTSDSDRLQRVLRDLRSMGVVIAAIGITSSGVPVERQYAPDGQVCLDSSQLAVVLADILKEHLEDV